MSKWKSWQILALLGCVGLVSYALYDNQQIHSKNAIYFPRELTSDEILKYSNTDLDAVVIYPLFTQYAYQDNGFYDYYKGKCNTCNVVSLNPLGVNSTYATGYNAFQVLQQLHYPFITDMTVDRHPEILKDYDTIILLHNEYMTQNEFNAISNHKNIFYLYPNSAYVKVDVDYTKWTMTLDRGHGYPDSKITNGFNFVTTSKYEYDLNCNDYKYETMPNGMTITCWPEFLIKEDRSLLQTIKDYPEKIPPLLQPSNVTLAYLPHCNQYGYCDKPAT